MKDKALHPNISSGVAGTILAGVGSALCFHLFSPDNHYHPSILNLLVFFGPAFFISGSVAALRGIFWGKRGLGRSTIKWCGIVMLLFGAFPWLYTPLIIPDGEMEGSGMMGTVLFITLGIPGGAAWLISFFRSE